MGEAGDRTRTAEGTPVNGICIQYFKEQQRYNRSRTYRTGWSRIKNFLEHYQSEVSGSYGSCYCLSRCKVIHLLRSLFA